MRIETLLAAIWHAPLRTVAVAQGRAWGAGADLFAVCDVRLAAEDATFRFPGAGFGLVLGTRRLADRIGPDAARRCVVDGLALDAPAAQAAGLATQVIGPAVGADANAATAPAAEALPGARDEAEAIIRTPPAVDRETLAQLHQATRPDNRDADLAALVRSASRPGLKQRIIDYRDRQAQRRRG